jgi:hypothetical protein
MESGSGVSDVKRNFILQQGLPDPPAASCPLQYSSLHFQPRLIGLIVLVAVILQEPRIFLALGGVLWWCALVPRLNPFDALYNATLARRPGGIALAPAPAPRRFSQGMAGSFALAIGFSLLQGWKTTAIVLEVFLVVAVGALVLGGFCLGSTIFHFLRGHAAFAKRTLPWSRGA